MSINIAKAREGFESHFGFPADIAVRAPGRVNIIGEHTDYNHGFVLPMAIERETVILARKREDGVLNAFAANLERTVEARLGRFGRNADEPWIDYIVGVARELEALDKPLHGADLMITGDVPIGSGLSSSASLEMAALVLFETMGGFSIEGAEGPKLGQRVENDFLGLSTGIMDQFVARMGKRDHALFLDCRSHEFDLVKIAFPDACFVIADTGVSRGLTASKYNERVDQCRQAVATLKAETGREDATHLRDFSMEDLEACAPKLDPIALKRARHVISENERTVHACRLMQAGKPDLLGVLMDESDLSLAGDYEVTCPELDAMTAIARDLPGCYGARMTGAGFGGCTVNLVQRGESERFARDLLARYKKQTGLDGSVIVSAPAEGAGLV